MSLLDNIVPASQDKANLSEEVFNELRSFIYKRSGIYFRDNKQYLLESQVGRRLKDLNLDTYRDYLHYLRNGHEQDELPRLFNAVTINETSFFRHPDQYESIVDSVIPDLLNQSPSNRIRIWSAACSTGDEPYTIALLLREQIRPKFPRAQFELIATDINTEVLEEARAGTYSAHAVRNVPPEYLRSYFTEKGDDTYVLAPTIRQMVQFRHLNLTNRDAVTAQRNFDLILCANVLIYFDDEIKQQVVTDLYKTINPGGYLFVGTSETLHGVTRALRPVRFENAIGYKKAEDDD